MNIYRIGKLDETSLALNETKGNENKKHTIKNDFDKLRKLAIEMVDLIFVHIFIIFNFFYFIRIFLNQILHFIFFMVYT